MMHCHHEQRRLPYTAQQLFTLVADVPSYPEFLPWCVAARMRALDTGHAEADLVIRFKAFCEQYTSLLTLLPPTDSQEGSIEVQLVRGPFSHLTNHWRFVPKDDGSCTLEFTIEFAFQSSLLNHFIGRYFQKAVSKMVAAFEERAGTLYGGK
jgi:coenzyme Q-binding protein COQ10